MTSQNIRQAANMIITHRLKHLLISAFLTMSVLACNGSQPVQSLAVCSKDDVTIDCLLQAGDLTLSSITDDFEWSSSAAELAIAYHNSGNTNRAWRLLKRATEQAEGIEDSKKRNAAFGEIAQALAMVKTNTKGQALINQLSALVALEEDQDKRWDNTGKLITASAVHKNARAALALAVEMPEASEAQSAYKARTLRQLAALLAKQGNFDFALEALEKITMSLTYYQAMARTDIASAAIKAKRLSLIDSLLVEFLRCRACHTVNAGGADGTGPNLNQFFNTKAAIREGFSYSEALIASGIVWTDEALDQWIKSPASLVAGTSMVFVGLDSAEDRKALIAYLKEVTKN